MVRPRRLELPRGFPHSDLNAARLPIPPRPLSGQLLCIIDCVKMQLNVPKIALKISKEPVCYQDSLDFMQKHVEKIYQGQANNLVWLLEHPALYSAGTSARADDLHDRDRFPVYQTNRGGQYTYHGPGQRIIYVMLDLRAHRDVRLFVQSLEKWVMRTLEDFNIKTSLQTGKIGIWVQNQQVPDGYDKIAALGIRLKKWISFHGVAVNINPDLEHFSGITPCGIDDKNHGVTSLAELGIAVSMQEFDRQLVAHFSEIFGAELSYDGTLDLPADLRP